MSQPSNESSASLDAGRPPLAALPKRVQRAIISVQRGHLLCRTFRVKEDGSGETTFAFEPSGRRCGRLTAEAAIASGYLAPQADGLFGEETAQTFVASSTHFRSA